MKLLKFQILTITRSRAIAEKADRTAYV